MVKITAYHRKRRFPDWREPPTVCDCCQEPLVVLTGNEVIYGKPQGKWPWIYLCMSCGAVCGLHPDSIYPLGTMASQKVRRLRAELHEMIDGIWKSKQMSRFKTYRLMAQLLKYPEGKSFHIGELDEEGCHATAKAFRAWEAAADFDAPPW